MSMQHENERLAAERVKWLGIMTSELATLGISKDALLPMTKHDEKKALSMLRRTNLPRHWRKELQYMLHNRRKAEIEIITDGSLKASGDNHHDDSEAVHALGSKLPSLRSYQEPMLVRYLLGKISPRIAK
ncbi:hypothetical protein WOLCODRAFT_104050 [Wolfiporia cocos MD-104 SS10]|uniref:Topoisomerase 6 subunit A/Spo11 TOPRIM domain-containing protein n=1 Tax=Wolfiporia cocos (strain MD-104) TaxID=742152 RepID=A0A2H3JXU9_WOLCO|nr:hypothetical protein WOLCODRAFT_104050 [Wolfiporia cocos MD-104 SS10]